MSEQVENPPAFPLHPGINPDWGVSAGMSLRDWFAGQALAGFLADGSQRALNEAHKEEPDFLDLGPSARARVINEQLAIGSYQIADAMLASRLTSTQPADQGGEG